MRIVSAAFRLTHAQGGISRPVAQRRQDNAAVLASIGYHSAALKSPRDYG